MFHNIAAPCFFFKFLANGIRDAVPCLVPRRGACCSPETRRSTKAVPDLGQYEGLSVIVVFFSLEPTEQSVIPGSSGVSICRDK